MCFGMALHCVFVYLKHHSDFLNQINKNALVRATPMYNGVAGAGFSTEATEAQSTRTQGPQQDQSWETQSE